MSIAGMNFLACMIQTVAQIISYLNNERKTKEKKALLQMLVNLQNTSHSSPHSMYPVNIENIWNKQICGTLHQN